STSACCAARYSRRSGSGRGGFGGCSCCRPDAGWPRRSAATWCRPRRPRCSPACNRPDRVMENVPSPGRVLYLTHRVPFPPDKGDRIRNYHLLRQMAKRGRVWLGCLADEPVTAETTAELRRLCERVAVVPVSGKRRW